MSCAPNEESSSTGNSKLRTERLIAEMSSGLHAMAQPLTILRGALWTLSLKRELPAEFARYLDLSNQELDRLCDLMTGLQRLVEAHQSAPEHTKFDVCELAATVADDLLAGTGKSGQIVLKKPEEPVYAIGDPARTEHALRIAIKISLAISSADDTIEVMILPRDGHVALVVRNISGGGKQLGSCERFFLSLTQISIVSQNGAYECVLHPFSVTLTLPAHQPGAAATEGRISL